MPTFTGTLTLAGAQGTTAQAAACRLDFDNESMTLIPGAGAPLSCDLGDIDEFAPQDFELTLKLYTGEKLVLSRFGKSYQDLCHDLQEAYRARLVQCLLLNDLDEIGRYDATVDFKSPHQSFSGAAECRLYQSNLAILPLAHTGLQWRLAEIDSVTFDEAPYAIALRSGEEVLTVGKLAKRTREFMDKLQAAIADVASRSAATVRSVFPFLSPEQFRRAAELLKEGRVAPVAQLSAIHLKTAQALAERVVGARLKPYFDYLSTRAGADGFYAGFQLIRKDEEPEPDTDQPQDPPDLESQTTEMQPPLPPEEETDPDTEVLHWFLFPLRNQGAAVPQICAWETTSRSGRATYFFRLFSPEEAGKIKPGEAASAVDSAIRRLNRALLLLNFRREPIYLPDDSLELQPRYRRYAIAARKIPVLGQLRSSFIGRAIHTSMPTWQQQVQKIASCI
jgi:hypothetical protein